MANTPEKAEKAYETARCDIANLIGFLECELTKETKPVQWPMVGTLRYVRKNLIETLAFISGLEESQIEESLEDMRNENEGGE